MTVEVRDVAMEMPSWVWILVGSGGAGVITTSASLIRHRMNIRFWWHALDTHGVDGLDAASRATHPGVEAISTWRRWRAAKKPPAPPTIQPLRPPPPLPVEGKQAR